MTRWLTHCRRGRVIPAVSDDAGVTLRPFPYPYRAMLAICSDLDQTSDRRIYGEIMRFLNTSEGTSMGPGVGLEVGNSIYFDMPPGQFAYWNTDDAGREMVRALIRSGHIDTLHSYGDLAASRDDVARSLEELERHDCRVSVWVDHSKSVANFGADIMCGQGDVPGTTAYHADLTIAYGIRYIWRGRVTSVVGQDVPARLAGIATGRHPLVSARTLTKEAVKRFLARCGSEKYAMHAPNRVLRTIRLRDGQPVYEFIRCNPYWDGVGKGATAEGVAEVLTDAFLDRLVHREGVCILYTHLGKIRDPRVPFDEAAVSAFRRLADAHHDGRILVTTTRRLLGYCRAVREVIWSVTRDEAGKRIEIVLEMPRGDIPMSTSDLDGLTFYVPDGHEVRVTVGGRKVADLVHNGPDRTGRPSVSLPWLPLEFPEL